MWASSYPAAAGSNPNRRTLLTSNQTTGDFPYTPHPYQVDVHTALAYYRFVVVVAHRRWGKTECAISSLLADALHTTKEDAQYGYIAPFLKQAKQIAWRKLKRMVQKMFGSKWKDLGIQKNEAELWIQLPNGARIQLFGADNADAIRGLYFDGVVIDEIADMKGEVWNAIIRPALADRQGWALMIGTPKGLNELYTFYQRGQSNPLWKSLMYSIADTVLPWLPPSEVKALQDDMTEAMFAQEMLCDFQASSDDVLFKLAILHKSAILPLKFSDFNGAAKVLGIDVGGAEKGSDRSVFTKKQGQMVWPQTVVKLDTPDLVEYTAQQIVDWKPDAVIVDNGKGFALVETLQKRGFDMVFGIDFGGTPILPQYANKKTEMFYRTFKAMRAGLRIPKDTELFAELSAHTVSLNDKGKLTVLKKDKVIELLRRSPDKADSLVLAHAFDVQPRIYHPLANHEQAGMVTTGAELYGHHHEDYDPYNTPE